MQKNKQADVGQEIQLMFKSNICHYNHGMVVGRWAGLSKLGSTTASPEWQVLWAVRSMQWLESIKCDPTSNRVMDTQGLLMCTGSEG